MTTATTKRATISFSDNDLKKLVLLQKAMDLPTLNQAISQAIKIADEIRTQKQKGDVWFKSENEERCLFIPGLEKRSE